MRVPFTLPIHFITENKQLILCLVMFGMANIDTSRIYSNLLHVKIALVIFWLIKFWFSLSADRFSDRSILGIKCGRSYPSICSYNCHRSAEQIQAPSGLLTIFYDCSKKLASFTKICCYNFKNCLAFFCKNWNIKYFDDSCTWVRLSPFQFSTSWWVFTHTSIWAVTLKM